MIRLLWQNSVKLAGETADEDLFVGRLWAGIETEEGQGIEIQDNPRTFYMMNMQREKERERGREGERIRQNPYYGSFGNFQSEAAWSIAGALPSGLRS